VSRVLVVGSANVDFTVALPRLPRPGETVSEGTLLVARGGKGANQAVAARRLGAEVRLIGCVGDDASGREVRQALAGEGIGVEALGTTQQAATGTALIVVDVEGRNQIAVAPGANRALTVADVDRHAALFGWAEVLVCSLEVPLATVGRALEHARRRGARTVLNPAPFPDGGVDFLALADYVTPNEGEAARLTGRTLASLEEADEVAAAVQALGPTHAILTLGERGVVGIGPEGRVRVPACRVTVVDTTGAGDAFNGALAVAIAEHRPIADALRFANAAAALACTRRGAQPAMPLRAAVENLLGSLGA
jgi:ribokinase